jgi:hypothetical protein
MKIHVKEIAYHRNGVCGEPFYVVLFRDGRDKRLAVVYADPGHVSVFDPDLLGAGVIAFGENSFRGDHYESDLRAAIRAHESPIRS